jgi:hypothetical protein
MFDNTNFAWIEVMRADPHRYRSQHGAAAAPDDYSQKPRLQKPEARFSGLKPPSVIEAVHRH